MVFSLLDISFFKDYKGFGLLEINTLGGARSLLSVNRYREPSEVEWEGSILFFKWKIKT